jgi:hypothetical protein
MREEWKSIYVYMCALQVSREGQALVSDFGLRHWMGVPLTSLPPLGEVTVQAR